ncbi:RNA polymerase III subunit RPC82-domain-containing protein [Spinellus fusiger]|nr:RNA polymerase III subunit RPC82-domain-containing protein [Spinellus fusiger]
MSQQARLCREIIEEEFGVVVGKVAHHMLLKGRLSLGDLVRYSKFTTRLVKESLVTLIQHGLAFFTESVDARREPTFYQVGAEQVLMRLRMMSILQMAGELWKEEGTDICRLLFLNGRMKISGIRRWVEEQGKPNKDKMEKYTRVFNTMATEQYITAVLPEHSRSAMDRYLAAEEKESEKYTITTSKELQAIKKAALASVEAELGSQEHAGMKRRMDDLVVKQPRKRTVAVVEEMEVEENVYFRVNYERFNMLFRNNCIVDYATERINRTAGQVVHAFFQYGKDKMKMLKEEDSPSATPMHIANLLPADVATRGDIVLQPDLIHPSKAPSLQDIVQGYISLLKADTAGFVKSKDERGASQYAINFSKLRNTLRQKIFEDVVREKLGVATCRILRILIDKGKLDESQVQKLAMLPAKDTREKLAMLNLKGFVEIQEVPRSADRAPGRSFHLWYVPLDKCYEELLLDVYRSIANLQQRKKEELKKRGRLIDKLNRLDVQENMDLLSEGDKAEIALMENIIERIEVSKKRLDEVIMIFRDF